MLAIKSVLPSTWVQLLQHYKKQSKLAPPQKTFHLNQLGSLFCLLVYLLAHVSPFQMKKSFLLPLSREVEDALPPLEIKWLKLCATLSLMEFN
jgi:hypothetical protein